MNLITQPIIGANYLPLGFRLIWRKGVRGYVFLPLLINIVIFSLLLWLSISQFGNLIDRLLPDLPDWLSWVAWLFWIFFALAAVMIIFYTFSLVANLVAAPFNGLLAEAVVQHLTGEKDEEALSFAAMLNEARQAFSDAVRKLVYNLAWTIPFLILFWIPGINIFAPLTWFLFTGWILALEYLEYPLSNRKLNFKQQRSIVRQHKLLALGFGSAVSAVTLVPLVNLLVMPAAVAGASALWVDHIRLGAGESDT